MYIFMMLIAFLALPIGIRIADWFYTLTHAEKLEDDSIL